MSQKTLCAEQANTLERLEQENLEQQYKITSTEKEAEFMSEKFLAMEKLIAEKGEKIHSLE